MQRRVFHCSSSISQPGQSFGPFPLTQEQPFARITTNNALFPQALAISNQNFELFIYQMERLREYLFYGGSPQQFANILKAMAD